MIEYRRLPHQKAVMESTKTNIFLGGGVGSGKTDCGSAWVLQKVQSTPTGVIGLITANSYSQLIDSTIRNLFKNWKAWNQVFTPTEPPSSYRPFNIRILGPHGWVTILCRSLEYYELLSGVELGFAWCDELYQTKTEAIDVVTARVRDTRVKNQILYTSTLDDPDSWMYERFVEKFNPEFDDVLYAQTQDNPFLPGTFIDRLKASYDLKTYERMVLAKWVSLAGQNIYYNFARADHVDEAVFYDEARPILWSHDFNIGANKPMSSCLCQKKWSNDSQGVGRHELHVFDEIILESTDTESAIQEFKSRYSQAGASNVIIYGDASGAARDTRSSTTDYFILSRAGFNQQNVPRSNPPIRDRHNAVNAMLKNVAGDIRIKIHPRCKTLIKGLESVQLKKGASYLEEETYSQHVTTALGYLVNVEFPIVKYVASGQTHWK
jgi:hypothetical protein